MGCNNYFTELEIKRILESLMFMFFMKNKNVKEYPTLHFDKYKLIIYMGYWPSVRSRWLDIGKSSFFAHL